jgi:hypothetical protein
MTNKLFFIRAETEGDSYELMVVAPDREAAQQHWVDYYEMSHVTFGEYKVQRTNSLSSWICIDEVPLNLSVAGAISWAFVSEDIAEIAE